MIKNDKSLFKRLINDHKDENKSSDKFKLRTIQNNWEKLSYICKQMKIIKIKTGKNNYLISSTTNFTVKHFSR